MIGGLTPGETHDHADTALGLRDLPDHTPEPLAELVDYVTLQARMDRCP